MSAILNPQSLKKINESIHLLLGSNNDVATKAYWGISYSDFVASTIERINLVNIDFNNHYSIENQNLGKNDIFSKTPNSINEAFEKLGSSANDLDALSKHFVADYIQKTEIIGLNGPIGVGKDTLADSLVEDGFFKLAFADTLRIVASHLYSIPLNYFVDRDIKDSEIASLNNQSPRRVLQLLGTEVFRSIYPNIWIDKNALRIATYGQSKNISALRVVVSDVRFDDEADFCRHAKTNSFMCFIEPRISIGQPNDAILANANSHISENKIKRLENDLIISNTGTISEYLTNAKQCIYSKLNKQKQIPQIRVR